MYSSISVVIPVYNSSTTIKELCDRLESILGTIAENYEIVMVDDCSKDDSVEQIKKICASSNAVKLIVLQSNFGQQNAILCGLRHAIGDYIATIDDDLQNPPEELEALMQEFQNGYDVVYGIPIVKRHNGVRNFGSHMADFLFKVVCRKPRDIRVSSFRVLKRHIADKITEERSSFVYISAITLRQTKNIGNVPVKHEARKNGRSNYNLLKLLKLFFNIYINYSSLSRLLALNKEPQYVIKEIIS